MSVTALQRASMLSRKVQARREAGGLPAPPPGLHRWFGRLQYASMCRAYAASGGCLGDRCVALRCVAVLQQRFRPRRKPVLGGWAGPRVSAVGVRRRLPLSIDDLENSIELAGKKSLHVSSHVIIFPLFILSSFPNRLFSQCGPNLLSTDQSMGVHGCYPRENTPYA